MKEKRQRSRLWLATILVFAVYFGAWIIAGAGDDRNWIVAIAGTGVTSTLAPVALIPMALFAIRRRWMDSLACLGLVGVFLLVSGQMRWPDPQKVPPGTPLIRVMSFNVEHLRSGAENVARLVRNEQIDVFAFQECGMGEAENNIRQLRALLPEFQFISDGSRTSGSRLPVLSQRSIPLTNLSYSWTMLEQVVDLGGQPVRILNVHAPSYVPDTTLQRPVLDWLRRWAEVSKEQTDLINVELDMISENHFPTVLCGDFNMTPVGRRYSILASVGRDSFAEAGWGGGWTMPAGLPMRRIDYIWAFPGVVPQECHVVDWRASDHAAVVASLAVLAHTR